MASHKATSGSRSRKATGRQFEAQGQNLSPSSAPDSLASNSSRTTENEKALDMTLSRSAAPSGWFHKKAYNIHCMVGGPVLNPVELTFVYLLLLGAVALTAAGAYKQLYELGQAMLRARMQQQVAV